MLGRADEGWAYLLIGARRLLMTLWWVEGGEIDV